MRFTTAIVAAVAAFANMALAQDATPGFAVFSTPATSEVVQAGESYVLKWTAGKYTGPVTISLVGGATQGTQIPLGDIATHVEVSTNQYKWNVDCSLGEAKIYGLKITSEADTAIFQWSFPFQISNEGCEDTSSVVPSPTPTPSATDYPTSTPKSSTEVTSTPAPSSSKTTVETTVQTTSKTTVETTAQTTGQTTGATTTLATTTTTTPAATTTGSSSTTVPTAAATKVAGSFALVGLAAAAVLAL